MISIEARVRFALCVGQMKFAPDRMERLMKSYAMEIISEIISKKLSTDDVIRLLAKEFKVELAEGPHPEIAIKEYGKLIPA